MRGSRKFCQRGSNFDNVIFGFFVDQGREDPNAYHNKRAIIGPASETPFKWRFACVLLMAQHWTLAWQLCDFFRESGPVLLKKLYFCDF